METGFGYEPCLSLVINGLIEGIAETAIHFEGRNTLIQESEWIQ